MRPTGSDYIPALDGLRAVAVALVLLFHVGLEEVAIGYVGVDIFFVISGFLITGIILREQAAGTFRLRTFFWRRFTRLMPALSATLILTMIAGAWILPPLRYSELGEEAMAAQVWISNFHFWNETTYFGFRSDSLPLLHTWSLGVEEQFYLFWPLLLLALGGRALGLWFASLAGVGFLAGFLLLDVAWDAVFYLMPFRIHEFALGALVAVLPAATTWRQGLLGSGAGLACLLALFLVPLEETYRFHEIGAVAAVGAALLIWGIRAGPVSGVLSAAPLRWIGVRSYAIYLVHWPIIVLSVKATDFRLDGWDAPVLVVSSIIAGHLLHVAVERPLRSGLRTFPTWNRPFLPVATALTIGALGLGAALNVSGGFPGRFADTVVPDFDKGREWKARFEENRNGVCNLGQRFPLTNFDAQVCDNPPDDGRRAFFVLGDSLASGNRSVLRHAYPEVYFGQLTLPGCPLRRLDLMPDAGPKVWCKERVARAFDIATSGRYDGIVLSLNAAVSPLADIGLLHSWARAEGLEVIILTHRPRFGTDLPEILAMAADEDAALARAGTLLETRFWEAEREVVDLFPPDRLALMRDVACTPECQILTPDGTPIYIDHHHLTRDGILWMAERLRGLYPDLFAAP